MSEQIRICTYIKISADISRRCRRLPRILRRADFIFNVNKKSDFRRSSVAKEKIANYLPSTTSFTVLPKRIFDLSSSIVQPHTPSSSSLTLSMCNAAVDESPIYRCPVPLISVLVSIVIMSTGLPSCSHVAGRIL